MATAWSVLESVPPGWRSPQPTAVLVHGLAGCADAPYMVRLGVRLVQLGIRVVRVNLRNSGIGFGLAKGVYHAGRSDDLREVLAWLKDRDGLSPVALVGFSLGANLVLKLAAEAADDPAGAEALDCVLAANPPIDLTACSHRMKSTGRIGSTTGTSSTGSAGWSACSIADSPSWAPLTSTT